MIDPPTQREADILVSAGFIYLRLLDRGITPWDPAITSNAKSRVVLSRQINNLAKKIGIQDATEDELVEAYIRFVKLPAEDKAIITEPSKDD